MISHWKMPQQWQKVRLYTWTEHVQVYSKLNACMRESWVTFRLKLKWPLCFNIIYMFYQFIMNKWTYCFIDVAGVDGEHVDSERLRDMELNVTVAMELVTLSADEKVTIFRCGVGLKGCHRMTMQTAYTLFNAKPPSEHIQTETIHDGRPHV